MNRVYFVRHGENPANLTKEFSHRKVDYSLTTKGVLQARQTAQYFLDKGIHEIYSSPLKRAFETASILAEPLGLGVHVMEEFREVNIGSLEEPPVSAEKWAFHNEIIAGWFDGRPERRFPDGENYFELCSRMQAGMRRILAGKTGRNMIVVGHGGIFTFTVKIFCPQADLEWIYQTENHNCSVSEVRLAVAYGEEATGELVSWAGCSHLSGEAARLVSGMPKPGEAVG